MTTRSDLMYAGYRFPGEVISCAVYLYSRALLSLRMVEEMLALRGIVISHETIRAWALKFGQQIANRIRQRRLARGDTWNLDEAVISIAGRKHCLWRAVDQDGLVLDVLVQRRRNTAAKRALRKLLKRQGWAPRVMVSNKLASYATAKLAVMPCVEHRQRKGLKKDQEQPPASPPTGTDDEVLHINRPGAAIPVSPRPSCEPPPPSRLSLQYGPSLPSGSNFPDLDRGDRRGLRGPRENAPAHFATDDRQVDGAAGDQGGATSASGMGTADIFSSHY